MQGLAPRHRRSPLPTTQARLAPRRSLKLTHEHLPLVDAANTVAANGGHTAIYSADGVEHDDTAPRVLREAALSELSFSSNVCTKPVKGPALIVSTARSAASLLSSSSPCAASASPWHKL